MKIWKEFNIIPNNKEIYEQAFTHKSFNNENNSSQLDYERIEWLGDSVLNQKVTEYIYMQNADHDEGMMTLIRKNAVGNNALSQFSKQLGLLDFLKTGNSNDNKSEKLYADIFESFIGALFLDNQHKVIDVVLDATVFKLVDQTINDPDILKSPKTVLQEKVQLDSSSHLEYITNDEPINNQFHSKVILDKITLGSGFGKTKQKAEITAAQNALSKMTK